MYNVKKYECDVNIDEYVRDYVNVEEFLGYCKECKNYSKVWSCPPYDFEPEEYWKKFSVLHVIARKIEFEPGTDEKGIMDIMKEVKADMSRELYEAERQYEGSVSLSAGSCSLCRETGCSRLEGKPCRYPEIMRYSIESIGGNVGLTVSKLLGIELEWIEEGKLPDYYVLVGGLLKK